ncbi:hypothetical protein BCR44DRAFT_35438 [Catenaria anguillulae PL171]|uniref:Invertebrate defensins family profile domain-containing protein n=1 Tax=Catenaria anguillulae PL171 TaxID=765915 RepID=A0A1Y2HMI2_9FUNG|nr:hypothetical protein BCR44DRAFT_35438 [Catenaria anguillulae PL171]
MKTSALFALAFLALGMTIQAAPTEGNVDAASAAISQPESDVGIMGEFCIADSCSATNAGKCEQKCREHGGVFTRMEGCGWFKKRCCCRV